ncbi:MULTISPECIES: phosphate ABC transporter permease PstA [Cyanophyceae]|uniref:phosphate ABC transporter permease PstA n=1 Tax=Cyanophyceae TaxID=3028117 RepID=UPI0016863164|nr:MULTISPECIES: phosphate ABC transporter permease PstA [Cyanophyceae]MBD1914637.1 phosphate ABC transporter permease PstA [Phormidium sp. FACHB-77]MBD2030556.1 phosphate ABC transporter permease PstA [Phormidium sp. FACHB-322]MBD2052409.1 phosphate ABC transporter permease PstA [Leptolyngbya sp. FACHB-60]
MTPLSSQTTTLDAGWDIEQKQVLNELGRRQGIDKWFSWLALLAVIFSLFVLVVLLVDVLIDGVPVLNWNFLVSFPSRNPEVAGIVSALVGTIWVMVLVALFTFPIGVGAGIFLEEFVSDSWFARAIEINISNLAGVPSIIYGLLGLQVFVRLLFPITQGRTVLAGALTLALLVLPIVIIATRESLRAIPASLRQAGFALGATRWQVIRSHIFPLALPGILTGVILALSRAIGETAPLITIGALTYIPFLPEMSLRGLQSPFTVLPIQIFNWVSRPQPAFHGLAAGAIIVLMVILLLMNATAIYLRNRFQK